MCAMVLIEFEETQGDGGAADDKDDLLFPFMQHD